MKSFLLLLIFLVISTGFCENYLLNGGQSSLIKYKMIQKVEPQDGILTINLSYVIPETFESPTYNQQITNFNISFNIEPDNKNEWMDNHRKWAKAEAKEILSKKKQGQLKASLKGDIRMRKRRMKEFYYSLPIFIRPFIFYLYNYVIKLGFLDGFKGLKYHFLHAFWFRMMVDIEMIKNGR